MQEKARQGDSAPGPAYMIKSNFIHPLDALFHPRGIAVVGASNKPDNWATFGFLRPLLDFGFKGGVYPVNLSASPVCGLKAYSRVSQIPDPVDYVVLSVPSEQVMSCLEDCAARGVKFVCIYSAGFSEGGLAEGLAQEAKFLTVARKSGMRLLGPNCIGIYYPAGHITFSSLAPRSPGNVAYVSQSGRFCNDFLSYCEQRGLSFSKVVSFGNALDINEADLLEYMGQDSETGIITAYVEGIRDGGRFAKALRKACEIKPVIIIKGGFTEAGRRATMSHTASLSGHEEVWRGLMKQSGAISAGSLEEMSDVAMTFNLMTELKGVRVSLVGAGGGANVLASDALSRQGFNVPAFSADTQRKLRKFIPVSGTWVTNPVDFSPQTAGDPLLTSKAVETVGNLDEIDLVIVHYMMGKWASTGEERARSFGSSIREVSERTKKPVAVVLETHGYPEIMKTAHELKLDWIRAGLCVYPDIERAADCLGKLARYRGIC